MKNAAMTMDAKLNQTRISTNASTQQASKKKRVFNYIQELKDELKKVSWTAKGELKLSTKIVIGATFLFGLGIYLFDLVIKGCLDFIAIVAHYIFG
jgi:preprotein translocase subunit SecE